MGDAEANRPLLVEQNANPDAQETQKPRDATKTDIALNVVSVICFPLGVPYAMGQSGWWAGSIFLFYSAVSTYVNTLLLGEICVKFRNLNSYPAIAEKAFGETYGSLARVLTSSVQWIGFFFLVVYNLVMLGEYMSILDISSGVCQQQYIIGSALVLAILGQIPTWKDLAWLAMVFLTITLFGLITLIDEAFEGHDSDPDYSSITFSSIINGMTAMAFAYGGAGMFPEMIQEMKDPADFNGPTGSLSQAYVVIVPSYVLAGVVGFWAFGTACSGNIVENFPDNKLRTVLLAFNLFLYIMGSLEANQLLAGKVEQYMKVDPTGWLEPRTQQGWAPGLVRGCVRVGLIALQLFFAEMLFSAGVGDIQSLTGAIAGVLLTYVLPVVFYVKIFKREESGWLQGGSYWFLIGSAAIGVFITVAGVVVAIKSIISAASDYSLFHGSCSTSLG